MLVNLPWIKVKPERGYGGVGLTADRGEDLRAVGKEVGKSKSTLTVSRFKKGGKKICLVKRWARASLQMIPVKTPCAKPSSAAEEKPVASPAKEVSVETKVVVVKTEHEASASSAAKEVPVARPPITVEEEKYVVEKTQLEAIVNICVYWCKALVLHVRLVIISAFFVNLQHLIIGGSSWSLEYADDTIYDIITDRLFQRWDNCLVADGLGAGRSPVIGNQLDTLLVRMKHPSPESLLHRRESARLDALENGRSTSTIHPAEPVSDTASARSSDFADNDELDEQR
ncbi:hypothetical protein Bca52824_062474 [Brassica carinata]|uniref:Uncharacterized protein n=1 Tax=Brassica carinata TaxID=52824 RepID=A0A8X7QCN1_BRACI|nr:hypothetical protein Bca52824_062474 [Brassica carinata]